MHDIPEITPNQTIYINNLNEKIKKEGLKMRKKKNYKKKLNNFYI